MAFAVALKISAAICGATGALDLLLGPNFVLDSFGAPSFPAGQPIVDSQYRFFGGIWAGYGALVWWASNDVRSRREPLAILGGVMMLGGVGRLVSAWCNEFWSPLMIAFAGIELIGPLVFGLFGRSLYAAKTKP